MDILFFFVKRKCTGGPNARYTINKQKKDETALSSSEGLVNITHISDTFAGLRYHTPLTHHLLMPQFYGSIKLEGANGGYLQEMGNMWCQ